MSTKTFKLKVLAAATIAAFGVALTMPAAYAQDGPRGQGGPTGTQGHKGSGAPTQDVGGRGPGQGQGGPSADSDAKGPRFGGDGSQPAPGTQGGRPVWAQEGVPSDTELGRLNVVRAPSHVIDRSLANALEAMNPNFYNQVLLIAASDKSDAEKLVDLQTLVKLSFTDTTYTRIDSPLENLGLYRDLLDNGEIVASTVTYANLTPAQTVFLASVFVGSASDKTIAVSTSTVDSITKILGVTLPAGVTSEDVAVAAEAVRVAILEAHG
jgi:hypothetical protein